MKRVTTAVLALWIACMALAGCTPDFNGSRVKNDTQYLLEYTQFDSTDSHTLSLQEGDELHVGIVSKEGSVSIAIEDEAGEPVYRGTKIADTCDFDVAIQETGAYTVTVTGETAEGSVSFTVKNDKNGG